MHVLERGRRQSGTYNRCRAWWELVVFEHGRRANVLGRVGWGVWGGRPVYMCSISDATKRRKRACCGCHDGYRMEWSERAEEKG